MSLCDHSIRGRIDGTKCSMVITHVRLVEKFSASNICNIVVVSRSITETQSKQNYLLQNPNNTRPLGPSTDTKTCGLTWKLPSLSYLKLLYPWERILNLHLRGLTNTNIDVTWERFRFISFVASSGSNSLRLKRRIVNLHRRGLLNTHIAYLFFFIWQKIVARIILHFLFKFSWCRSSNWIRVKNWYVYFAGKENNTAGLDFSSHITTERLWSKLFWRQIITKMLRLEPFINKCSDLKDSKYVS